jgi:hypothetical protein
MLKVKTRSAWPREGLLRWETAVQHLPAERTLRATSRPSACPCLTAASDRSCVRTPTVQACVVGVEPRGRSNWQASGPDGCQQRTDFEVLDDPFDILGQNLEAHLGPDLRQGPSQEVGGAVPSLQRAERVFLGPRPIFIASGIRLRRACIASSTPSCTQRLTRRVSVGLQRGLSAQPRQAVRLR